MMKAGTRYERVSATLADIGKPVLNGAISTFLAVVLLSQSASYVFQVLFKQFFATVVLGVAHGMILLPVLLLLVGPEPYQSALRHSIGGKGDGAGSGEGVEFGRKTTTDGAGDSVGVNAVVVVPDRP